MGDPADGVSVFRRNNKIQVTPLKNDEFLVVSHVGYVDARKPFLGRIRSKYACRLRDLGGARWRLMEISMKEPTSDR